MTMSQQIAQPFTPGATGDQGSEDRGGTGGNGEGPF